MRLNKDWDKFIASHLEPASNFGGEARVISFMAVRAVVLNSLEAHGIDLRNTDKTEEVYK